MSMSANISYYVMVVFLITVAVSPTINSVLGSPSTTINNSSSNSSNPLSNVSSSAVPTTEQKENKNLTSTFEITDQIKTLIDDRLDKNKTNAAIVIGFIDPNGTQFYSHGKMSNIK